jgi:hypothetical protein
MVKVYQKNNSHCDHNGDSGIDSDCVMGETNGHSGEMRPKCVHGAQIHG